MRSFVGNSKDGMSQYSANDITAPSSAIGSSALRPNPMELDDEEWEYEYDENETETFYVTIDLSSRSGPARSKRKLPPQTQEDGEEAEGEVNEGEDGNNDDGVDADDNDEEREQTPPGSPAPSHGGGRDEALEAAQRHPPQDSDPGNNAQKQQKGVQILDLHTSNPIISYDNQIFNCHWSSTIGTDMLFSKPSANPSHPVVRSTHGYDLVALTSAKLIGTSAHLAPRKEVRVSRKGEIAAAQGRQLERGTHPTSGGAAEEPIIPVGSGASAARHSQARFLERLMRAKDAKGETDSVTVYSKKRLTQTGWRALQSERRRRVEDIEILRHLAEEGDEEAQSQLEQLVQADPLGSTHGDTPSEAGPSSQPQSYDGNLWRSALGTPWGDDILRTPRRGPGRPGSRRGRGSGRATRGFTTMGHSLMTSESSPQDPSIDQSNTATPAARSEFSTPQPGTSLPPDDGAQT
ncbi:hypothetical protein L228DRAFT_270816 [Xylona heveae TC161]|uniref:Transcription factor TFIIIC triple barrel domain-containing protein n=1 Tax=Xylona heveae (strain CBS 132557 / TC161) TaxID=1328760 RepID=A0A165A7H8_XYLHT|nr:hypothetical protein L228DRAFT_270816 [Xylona heveae TC161]KZF20062.1 hypothetical protein L228DRAFT_270816 [Xylona heveae TC161]